MQWRRGLSWWVLTLAGLGFVSVADAAPLQSLKADKSECEPRWALDLGGNLGLDGDVLALTIFDDGNGPALYAGGRFTEVGGVAVNHIAKWDGESWSALGTGTSSAVRSLAVHDDGSGPALFVGGEFIEAGGVSGTSSVARWDGSAWSALGEGVSSTVRSFAVFDDGRGGGPALYAAGDFGLAFGASNTSRIARWDGTNWSALGTGVGGQVQTLLALEDGLSGEPELYAGGFFTTAGGQDANYVARWDGESWSPLGSGAAATVAAFALFDDGLGGGPALYVGGVFTSAGDVPGTSRIARWDGENWSEVGGGIANAVLSLAVFDDGAGDGPALYAGGGFVFAGGNLAANIARWNGAEWSGLNNGVNGGVNTLLVLDEFDRGGPALMLGGNFNIVDGTPADRIASWRGCGTGIPGDVNGDGVINAVDVQLVINAALGIAIDPAFRPDLNGDGIVNAIDVQRVINFALGI